MPEPIAQITWTKKNGQAKLKPNDTRVSSSAISHRPRGDQQLADVAQRSTGRTLQPDRHAGQEHESWRAQVGDPPGENSAGVVFPSSVGSNARAASWK
jgi:hypothetical protein